MPAFFQTRVPQARVFVKKRRHCYECGNRLTTRLRGFIFGLKDNEKFDENVLRLTTLPKQCNALIGRKLIFGQTGKLFSLERWFKKYHSCYRAEKPWKLVFSGKCVDFVVGSFFDQCTVCSALILLSEVSLVTALHCSPLHFFVTVQICLAVATSSGQLH